jgi:hypothetical protein
MVFNPGDIVSVVLTHQGNKTAIGRVHSERTVGRHFYYVVEFRLSPKVKSLHDCGVSLSFKGLLVLPQKMTLIKKGVRPPRMRRYIGMKTVVIERQHHVRN